MNKLTIGGEQDCEINLSPTGVWGWDYMDIPECVRGDESSDSLTETAVRMGDLGEGRQIPFSFASLDSRLWMGDDVGLGVFRDALCTVVGVADSDATCSVGQDSNVSFAYSSATELSTLSLPDPCVLQGTNPYVESDRFTQGTCS